MERRIKLLYGILAICIVIPVALTYYTVYIEKDYFIDLAVQCDPAASSCFAYECNWEESDCFRDMEDGDAAYYSIVTIKQKDIPCDVSHDESCIVSCEGLSEKDCVQVFCEEDDETECATAEDVNEEGALEEDMGSEEGAEEGAVEENGELNPKE